MVMNGLLKVAAKIGAKPIAIVTLIISCLAVFIGMTWHIQTVSAYQQQQMDSLQNSNAEIIHTALSQHIAYLQSEVDSLASNAQLIDAIANGDMAVINAFEQQAVEASALFKKVCVIDANIDQPDDSACIPITFATLASLRKAKTEGYADIAIVNIGKDDAYTLLAHSIKDRQNSLLGVLAITLEPTIISAWLAESYGHQGFIELKQGKEQGRTVAWQGTQSWRVSNPIFSKALPDSHWSLSYWSKPPSILPNTIIIIGGITAVVAMMWLLYLFWLNLLMRHDVLTLKEQLKDLANYKLKTKYPIAQAGLTEIVDTIQRLGQELVSKESKRKASILGKGQPKGKRTDTPVVLDVDSTIFKQTGIRGIVDDNFDEDVVRQIGLAFGSEAMELNYKQVIVGFDGRLSSEKLSRALIEGINAAGCDVVDLGQVATPIFYFACQTLKIDAAVMMTENDNPADYNGLKLVLAGKPFVGDDLQRLYKRIKKSDFSSGSGVVKQQVLAENYIKRVVENIKLKRSIRVVVDAGNGIVGQLAPAVFEALGCDVIQLHCKVDGSFPNHFPQPEQPENLTDLMSAVESNEAELGIAFSADGSRLGVVDAHRNIIWADRLMIMFAQEVLSRNPGITVLYDVKSTDLLMDAVLRAGGEAIATGSSPACIVKKLAETQAALAGEMSGHIFFKERWHGFEDGVYAAARLLEILADDPLERTPTDVFSAIPNRYNTPEIMIEMDEQEALTFVKHLASDIEFQDAEITNIDGIRADFTNGWGVVQTSKVQPGILLRFEADTEENLEYMQQQFKQQMLQVKPTLNLTF
jgi:phosphomannomutase/phosphoglucomutase